MTDRKMRPIPISTAENVARNFGYDQVVIMARRISQPLPPLNANTARPDDGVSGEHITTYGVDTIHCQVAALMGNHLKRIAQWPSPEDSAALDKLLDDLESGTFDYTDYDARLRQISALHRLLKGSP